MYDAAVIFQAHDDLVIAGSHIQYRADLLAQRRYGARLEVALERDNKASRPVSCLFGFGLVALLFFLRVFLSFVLVQHGLTQGMSDRLVLFVDALDFETFLMCLTARGRSNTDDDDNGNDDRQDLGEEKSVLDEELTHTARPTLFFCSTCSAR